MRAFMAIMLTLPLLAGCLSDDNDVLPGFDGSADLILQDGMLWSTGESAGFASSIAIADGRIVAVGNDLGDLVDDDTRVVDLDGAMVLPGFRDHHLHALSGGSRPLVPEHQPIPSDQEQLQSDLNNHNNQLAFHGHRHAAYRAGAPQNGVETLYEQCTAPDATAVPGLISAFQQDEAEMAAQGITTVIDAGMSDLSQFEALLQMQEQGLSKIRWLVRVVPGCYELLDNMDVQPHEGAWVQWHGVKLYGDGYMGAWIAALRQPYSDRPAWSGVLVYDDASLDHFVAEAAARGLNIGTHAIGDATIQLVLDTYERAGITPDHRWTIEHVQVTSPDLIERFAELGVVPSVQLSFAVTDRRMAEDRLGSDRLADAYDWRGLLEAGVVVAGGTDWPIEVITPLWGLQRESTRTEVDGDGPFLPGNGLSLDQALTTITYGSAYGANEDDERGTLAVGHMADLVVVRENLFAIDPTDIAGATVLMTLTNGKVTFEGERSYPPNV